MRKEILFVICCCMEIVCSAQMPPTPDKIYGRFFRDVQMARVFPDSKTFVDCVPKKSPAEIISTYQKIISNPARHLYNL